MNREKVKETPKSSHTGVITRSRRKSSQVAKDTEEVHPIPIKESRTGKRAQIDTQDLAHEELSELQVLFSNFVQALNSKDNESISDRVKRGNRRKIMVNASEELPNRSLKRVKREHRKAKVGKKPKEDSRKTSKKQVTLEPIEEDVKKENINGDQNDQQKKDSPEDSTNQAESNNQSQNSVPKETPKSEQRSQEKQNSNINFNGKIPELAPV